MNCVGIDEAGIKYSGGIAIISEKGEIMKTNENDKEDSITAILDLDTLRTLREKFPVWKDADSFQINI